MDMDQEASVGVSEQETDLVKKPLSTAVVDFLALFGQEATPDEKIRTAIGFMRTAISQTGTPRFKDFWEVRRLCLPLFKENLNPKVRVQLWSEYIELSGEARRIKEILDEQSSFAAEQIELAIAALENDLAHYEQLLSQVPPILFPEHCATLLQKREVYNLLQRELNLLNTMASRVNALRKEVVKTEMRVRFKNRFFDRLSACGDRVFPQRKEQIKKISDQFSSDVAEFLKVHFEKVSSKTLPLFVLRDEIKALQSMAKELTLNTQAFTETRLQLSKCWDQIREMEKERKKDFAQKKQAHKQNFDLVMEKIKIVAEKCLQEEGMTHEEINALAEEVLEFMKEIELGRDEVRHLRDELQKAKKPVLDRYREKEQERLMQEKEEDLKRQHKLQDFKNQLQALLQEGDQIEIAALIERRDQLMNEFERLSLKKAEKQVIERLFKQVKDCLNEKKEKAVMALSADDLEALEQLKAALQERKQQRQEIRELLENYRKALGGSGLDFEKAMAYGESVEIEKERLERANAAIQEIEEKISDLQG
jgi:hypothetical protein